MPKWCKQLLVVIVFLGLTSICSVDAIRWVGKASPCFWVYPNLIVASNRFPVWKGVEEDVSYPAKVVAVDGINITDADNFLDRVSSGDVGSSLLVTLKQGEEPYTVAFKRLEMQWPDLFWLFGVPLFIACIFFTYGLVISPSMSQTAAARSVSGKRIFKERSSIGVMELLFIGVIHGFDCFWGSGVGNRRRVYAQC